MVNRARVSPLNQARPGPGLVVYWMSRDQRVRDNWGFSLRPGTGPQPEAAPGSGVLPGPGVSRGHPAPVRLYAQGVAGGGRGPGRFEPAVFPANRGPGPGTARLCFALSGRGRGERFFAVAPGAGLENRGGFEDRGFPGGSGRPQRRTLLAGLPQGGIRRLHPEAQAEKALAYVSGKISAACPAPGGVGGRTAGNPLEGTARQPGHGHCCAGGDLAHPRGAPGVGGAGSFPDTVCRSMGSGATTPRWTGSRTSPPTSIRAPGPRPGGPGGGGPPWLRFFPGSLSGGTHRVLGAGG